jgi:hypothetical protein
VVGCGVVWCGVVWCGVVWCGVVGWGVVWWGVVWCGVVWCGVVWCGVVWCGVVCESADLIHSPWSLLEVIHHHITSHHVPFRQVFDIVGPVCESADFLGKDRTLPTPGE